MSPARFTRLIEQESIDKVNAYKAVDFLADLRKGIWSELDGPTRSIDASRRALQRAYLDLMYEKLNGRTPATDDARAFIRGELRALAGKVNAAAAGTTDRATQASPRRRAGSDREGARSQGAADTGARGRRGGWRSTRDIGRRSLAGIRADELLARLRHSREEVTR